MVESGLLEAVIGLPNNLFYSTSIPACILVFRATPREGRTGFVQFIDASARFTKGRNQNQMTEADVQSVIVAYRTGDDPDGDESGQRAALHGKGLRGEGGAGPAARPYS